MATGKITALRREPPRHGPQSAASFRACPLTSLVASPHLERLSQCRSLVLDGVVVVDRHRRVDPDGRGGRDPHGKHRLQACRVDHEIQRAGGGRPSAMGDDPLRDPHGREHRLANARPGRWRPAVTAAPSRREPRHGIEPAGNHVRRTEQPPARTLESTATRTSPSSTTLEASAEPAEKGCTTTAARSDVGGLGQMTSKSYRPHSSSSLILW